MRLSILSTVLLASRYASVRAQTDNEDQSSTSTMTMTSSASLSCATGEVQTKATSAQPRRRCPTDSLQQIRILLLIHQFQNRRMPRRRPSLWLHPRKRKLRLSNFVLPHAHRSSLRGLASAEQFVRLDTSDPTHFPPHPRLLPFFPFASTQANRLPGLLASLIPSDIRSNIPSNIPFWDGPAETGSTTAMAISGSGSAGAVAAPSQTGAANGLGE
ncbi:hypothetical protein K458DRAFT_460698 [Lentithecium fluviatile CBS 122367]|uniref:Uncharacterized protein n=1 Tax=Lentithecium fluviatile CBS 122367 TaxID=1168545 RepID=A0A6G1INT7_9PLEO|nr:hypothetical protein K458DRAFT_460698 [Lentithecium fluviatile CBS 122367]